MAYKSSVEILLTYEAMRELGLPWSRAWVMKLVKLGRFPTPIKISTRTVRWLRDDFDGWLASRPRGVGERRGLPAK